MKLQFNRKKWNYSDAIVLLLGVYSLKSVLLVQQEPVMANTLDILQWIGFLYAVYEIFQPKYTLNCFLYILTIESLLLLGVINSGVALMFKWSVFIIAGMNLCWQEIYPRLGRCLLLLVVVTVLLGATKILPSQIVRRGYSTLGFSHSNVLAMKVLTIISCYILSRFDKLNCRDYLLLLILILVTLKMTDSRTAVLSMLMLFTSTVLLKYSGKQLLSWSFVRLTVVFLPVICLAISWYVGSYYNPDDGFFQILNSAMTGRPVLAYNFLNNVQLTLFGQQVAVTMVENTYLVALYNWGVIPATIALMFYMYAIYSTIREEKYGNLACLVTFLFYGLAEGSAFDPFTNVALLSALSHSTKKGQI